MIASGLMPRSPVWLRKIPSTVSGSQGSRRGLRPAVRFAFPLGARLNITLRARPCQELFSESFSGRPAGRGAPRLPGFGPSRRRVRYYTRPRRPGGGKPARTQDADNSSAAERRGWRHRGGALLRPHARPPRNPGVSPQSIDITAPDARRLRASALRGGRFNCVYSTTYISRRIGLTFRPGVLPPSSRKRSFPYRWRFLIRLRQTPRKGGVASRKKNGRLRARPPSARAIPSATVPGRFSMSEGFHHFDIEEAKVQSPIRMLKHFHRVQSYTCMPRRPWPRS